MSMATSWSYIRLTRTRTCSSFRHKSTPLRPSLRGHKNPPPPLRPSLRGWCHAVLLRRVDDRPVVVLAGPRRRGGRVRLEDGDDSTAYPEHADSRYPFNPDGAGVPRRQALPRTVLAHPRARRGDRAHAVHHVRAEAPVPPPGAGGQAGRLDRRPDRQPARPGRRDQPVAGGPWVLGVDWDTGSDMDEEIAILRGLAAGGYSVHHGRSRPAAGQDRAGAERADPRPGRRSLSTRPCAGPRRWATAGRHGGGDPAELPALLAAWPSTAAPPAPTAARSRST